jgi:hypothetical protein
MGSLLFHSKKTCCNCGSTRTRIERDNAEHWYYNLGKDKPICKKCHSYLFAGPKFRAAHRESINRVGRERLGIKFLYFRKQIYMDFRQRTGYCSKCPNNIYDGTCKITNMHHLFYIIIVPWFGRIELCNSCHTKTKNVPRNPITGRFISS